MFVTTIKCTELDGGNGSAFIHHLVSKCCLGLMRLHSSLAYTLTRHLLGRFVDMDEYFIAIHH